MKFSSRIFTSLWCVGVVSSLQTENEGSGRQLDVSKTCFGSIDFSVYFKGQCNYETLESRMKIEIDKNEECGNSAREEILLLLGITDPTQVNQAKDKVTQICLDAVDKFSKDPKSSVDFPQIAGKGKIFDKNYYDGGTFWNQEYQTNYDTLIPGEPSNVLSRDADRVDDVYETVARKAQFKWPDMPNFANCTMNAAMCCWVTDRQANDNNGNCAKPYDTKCTDADPGDNCDVCGVDFARSGTDSVHMEDGFSLYEGKAVTKNDSKEGAVHCHGLAWGINELEPSARYKANNLFYVSMSDHMHDRGYTRNVPGAPMCGCLEQMPIVSRSDCTEIAAKEFWKFSWNAASSSMTAALERAEIKYNACRGDGGNNDLFKYYKRLRRQGRATNENYQKMLGSLVGNDNCHVAATGLLVDKGYERAPLPEGWDYGWCVGADGGSRPQVKVGNDDYGPDHESIKKCEKLCGQSTNFGCQVNFGRGNRGCYRYTAPVAKGNQREQHLCHVGAV